VADEVYRPLSENDDETPPPAVDFKIDSYTDFQKALKEHVGVSDHDVSAEEVADDITPRRQREEAPTPENASERPLVRMRSTKDSLSLQEASDDIRFSRARKLGEDLLASGYTQDQVNEYAREKIADAQDGSPDNPDPPVEVKLPTFLGEEEGRPLTASEAAEKLSDWREQQERQRQADLAELVGGLAEQAQAEAPQAQSEPQQQSQPQPTPEQTERAQLARERAWVTHLAKMSGTEAALRNDLNQLGEAIYREFPSLRNGPPDPAHVEQLRISDPARHQKLMMADAMVRERQQKIAAVMQQRQAQEAQRAQINAQARAAARAEQDRAFEQIAAQQIPGWERNHAEVRAQARTTLENAGLSQEEIHHLWNSDDTIDAHSSALQLILAKAASWDMAQARAKQARQTAVPPVQKPGTWRARDDGAASVAGLSAKLGRVSGREALRVATELTKARRANGG
jgi:hypothetical protein